MITYEIIGPASGPVEAVIINGLPGTSCRLSRKEFNATCAALDTIYDAIEYGDRGYFELPRIDER